MSHSLQYEFKSVLVRSKSRPFFKSRSIPAKPSEENASPGVTDFSFSAPLVWGFAVSMGQVTLALFQLPVLSFLPRPLAASLLS